MYVLKETNGMKEKFQRIQSRKEGHTDPEYIGERRNSNRNNKNNKENREKFSFQKPLRAI